MQCDYIALVPQNKSMDALSSMKSKFTKENTEQKVRYNYMKVKKKKNTLQTNILGDPWGYNVDAQANFMFLLWCINSRIHLDHLRTSFARRITISPAVSITYNQAPPLASAITVSESLLLLGTHHQHLGFTITTRISPSPPGTQLYPLRPSITTHPQLPPSEIPQHHLELTKPWSLYQWLTIITLSSLSPAGIHHHYLGLTTPRSYCH